MKAMSLKVNKTGNESVSKGERIPFISRNLGGTLMPKALCPGTSQDRSQMLPSLDTAGVTLQRKRACGYVNTSLGTRSLIMWDQRPARYSLRRKPGDEVSSEWNTVGKIQPVEEVRWWQETQPTFLSHYPLPSPRHETLSPSFCTAYTTGLKLTNI